VAEAAEAAEAAEEDKEDVCDRALKDPWVKKRKNRSPM
jgi:hypothetical protein